MRLSCAAPENGRTIAPMSSAPPFVQAADVPLELNPRLDRSALAQEFARSGRIHIPAVLTEPSAVRLYRALQQETPWTLTRQTDTDLSLTKNTHPTRAPR